MKFWSFILFNMLKADISYRTALQILCALQTVERTERGEFTGALEQTRKKSPPNKKIRWQKNWPWQKWQTWELSWWLAGMLAQLIQIPLCAMVLWSDSVGLLDCRKAILEKLDNFSGLGNECRNLPKAKSKSSYPSCSGYGWCNISGQLTRCKH